MNELTSTPQKLKKFSSSGVKNGEYATEKRIPRRFDYVSTPPHSKSQDCARQHLQGQYISGGMNRQEVLEAYSEEKEFSSCDDDTDKMDTQNNPQETVVPSSDEDSPLMSPPNSKMKFDVSHSLPPANPLAPKIYSEDFKVYTAFDLKFDNLPSYSKTQKYYFDEPSVSLKSLEEIQDKLKDEKTRTLFDYHISNQDRVVYQKYPGRADITCQNYRMGQQVFFSTVICRLSRLLRPDKKNFLQEKLQKGGSAQGTKVQTQLSILKKKTLQEGIKNRAESIEQVVLPTTSTNESIADIIIPLKNSQINPTPITAPPFSDGLKFSSEFESGNLFSAYQTGERSYDLIVSNDINTKGCTQWFFFKVQNTKKDMVKSGSLFNNGLCPVVFSQKENEKSGKEWVREGKDVRYFKNNIFREHSKTMKFYCSLTFSYNFQHDDDTVYFSHSFPYTFSDLQDDLNKIMINPEKNRLVSKKTLCISLAGNSCDMLTITSSHGKKRSLRKGIIIFARQHPGETGGSLMGKGVIDFLLSNSPEAEFLRDNCVFKIVPMVNPDGVIHGNYRCDLAGADLNRRWNKPKKKLHPTVFALKEMIKKQHMERETKLVIDLHGHSRKLGAFFYGCNYRDEPLKTRIFPFLLSKLNEKVSFPESRFSIEAYKESTARVTLWKELHSPNIFTLEASFYGYKPQSNSAISENFTNKISTVVNSDFTLSNSKSMKEGLLIGSSQKIINESEAMNERNKTDSVGSGKHFTIQDYLDIGRDLCINLYNLLKEEQNSKENKNGFFIGENTKLASQIQEMIENKALIECGNNSQSGSDSNPSEDDLEDEQMLDILPKNALSRKQKQLLAERNAKEKNAQKDKNKKPVPVQLPPALPPQVQSEIKRKQTNQMYLQRYMLKKQQEMLALKAKNAKQPIQKKDQEMQTDSSFLHDQYLAKEKKKQSSLSVSSNNIINNNNNNIKIEELTNAFSPSPNVSPTNKQKRQSPEKLEQRINHQASLREGQKVITGASHIAKSLDQKGNNSKGFTSQNPLSGIMNRQMSDLNFQQAVPIETAKNETRRVQQGSRQLRPSSKIGIKTSLNSPIKRQQRESNQGDSLISSIKKIEGNEEKSEIQKNEEYERRLTQRAEDIEKTNNGIAQRMEEIARLSGGFTQRYEENLRQISGQLPLTSRQGSRSQHINENGKFSIDLSSLKKSTIKNDFNDTEKTRIGEEKGRLPERFPGEYNEDFTNFLPTSKQLTQENSSKLMRSGIKSGSLTARTNYESKQNAPKQDLTSNFLPSLQSPKQNLIQQQLQQRQSNEIKQTPIINKQPSQGQQQNILPYPSQSQNQGNGKQSSNIFKAILPSPKEPIKTQPTSLLLRARQNLQSQLKQ